MSLPADSVATTIRRALVIALVACVDAAAVEGEIRNAATGALLAQGIDRRGAGAPPR